MSGDLSCIWTKHIDVTAEQVGDMRVKPTVYRALAIQIKDHNDNRALHCNPSNK